ncbi:MAG: S8 family serine peptidase, partial [Bacteroidota bacterium]
SVNNYQASKRGGSIELTRIKEFYTEKSISTLKDNGINTKELETVYTGAFQGFYAKNLNAQDVELLEKDKRVAFVEPNLTVSADFPTPINPDGISAKELAALQRNDSKDTALPNGEFLPWGVEYTGQGNAFNLNRIAWVIDSGIAPHPDLRIISGLSRSFVSNEPSWQDFNGHGTHVAGTIAARNNGSGVIGVAYGARVVAVKVLNAAGSGSTAGILAGVDYVYNNSTSGDVFNYSVGFNSRFTSNAIDNAFRQLDNRICCR